MMGQAKQFYTKKLCVLRAMREKETNQINHVILV